MHDERDDQGQADHGRGPGEATRSYVTRRVERLQSGYLEDRPWSSEVRGQLAELRRSIGAAGSADPRSWAIVLDQLPEQLQGSSRTTLATPTRGELAVLTALTTYAVHQQSQRKPMHRRGIRLGEAVRAVARSRARADSAGGLDEPTVDRMHRVSLAQTQELRAQSLRALVQLLRSSEVPLDYGRLAEDLFWLQDPRNATKVHLAWGRGLHRLSAAERQDTQQDHDTTPSTGEPA